MRLETGQRIGERYTLIERIGSGGMADVWSADDQVLGRPVALKFLHERYDQDEQFVERFRREAQAAAGLQHPNVVSVYDRGEFEGRSWIAMEYVQGASLKDLIARGLTVAESVEIVRQILAGARFAHERGIVHRDLKPHNVLVDAEGRARVTDFGIARAGASEITQTGSVLGTAQYLSPEQAQGLETNATSDIYSTGVILYEALTGKVPFDADTVVAIALKQVSEQPQPPSRLNPKVTPALDAVVMKALAKDPAGRFQSAEEFIRALDDAEEDPTAATALYSPAPPAVAAAVIPIDPVAEEQEEPDSRKKLIALAIIAALIGAVIAFALTRSEQVTVPTVIGETQSEATRILEAKGFAVETSNFESCDEPNTVAEQDPAAGTDADEGATVELSVSLGLSVSIPPDVIGMRVDRATKLLQDQQLQVRSQETFSDRPAGEVVRTDPAVGERVECESAVTVYTSKGADLVDLPNLLGMTSTAAQAELRRLGFVPNVETEDSDAPANEVIGQDPGPGSTLPKGEEVVLIVSNGAGSVVVPNVEGQLRDNAVATLQSRGATNIKIVEQDTDDATQDDRVTDQAPSSGTRIRSGDLVTIFVAVFVEPDVPDPDPAPDPDPEPDEPAPRERGGRP